MKMHIFYSAILFTISSFVIFPPPTTTAASPKEKCHPDDKSALLRIQKSFGTNPLRFPSWTPENDCCRSWGGVKCDSTTHRVTQLSIVTYDDLVGTIPSSAGELPYLTMLRFHHLPNLTGTIPESISNLQNLIYADFSFTSLSGPVPSFFSRMRSLRILYLNYNRFSGTIPPALSLTPNLAGLQLDHNQLTGSIPESFGSFHTRTDFYLILSHNYLTGPIPKSFGYMSFATLDLSRNRLTGDASFLFGKNKSELQGIDLSRNQLSFDVSDLQFPPRLSKLDLNHNRLYGSLPVTLADLPNLTVFNVSYNRLCGKIPVGGIMTSFDQSSYIHNKCLCGAPLAAYDCVIFGMAKESNVLRIKEEIDDFSTASGQRSTGKI